MRATAKALVVGIILWAVVFAVALLIFPLRASERPLFESVMPVVLTVGTVAAATLYFRRIEGGHLREGLLLGGMWFLVQILLDSLMFSRGPMQMSAADYVKDNPFGRGMRLEFKAKPGSGLRRQRAAGAEVSRLHPLHVAGCGPDESDLAVAPRVVAVALPDVLYVIPVPVII